MTPPKITSTLDRVARDLQKSINDRVRYLCSKCSPYQWEAVANEVASQESAGRWRYIVVTQINGYPEVAITHYLGQTNCDENEE